MEPSLPSSGNEASREIVNKQGPINMFGRKELMKLLIIEYSQGYYTGNRLDFRFCLAFDAVIPLDRLPGIG